MDEKKIEQGRELVKFVIENYENQELLETIDILDLADSFKALDAELIATIDTAVASDRVKSALMQTNNELKEEIEKVIKINHSFPICKDHSTQIDVMEGCIVCDFDNVCDELAATKENQISARKLIIPEELEHMEKFAKNFLNEDLSSMDRNILLVNMVEGFLYLREQQK